VRHARRASARHQNATTAEQLPGGLIVGLNANVAGSGGSSTTARIDHVTSQSGTKWLREEFVWSTVEPTAGIFDFSRYDHFMLIAARHDKHVLALLDGTPDWAGATWNTIPSNPSGYATFVAAIVGRYGPHGSLWREHPGLAAYGIQAFELWNEPYFDNGDSGDYDPARYAELVKAAVTAGRAVDRSATFLLSSEVTGRLVGSRWVTWIDALYQALPDLNKYFDGVAIHPYGRKLTELDGLGSNEMRRTELLRAAFVAHGAADKPLWITEVGWPTCTTGSDRCTDLAGQAASLTALIAYVRTPWAAYIKAVFVYHFEDFAGDPGDPENDYGLTTSDGLAKPALAIFRALAATSA
jgi:hypothetical protein